MGIWMVHCKSFLDLFERSIKKECHEKYSEISDFNLLWNGFLRVPFSKRVTNFNAYKCWNLKWTIPQYIRNFIYTYFLFPFSNLHVNYMLKLHQIPVIFCFAATLDGSFVSQSTFKVIVI
eukprot:NODE_261_length_11439_cov_1.285538.p13 type:complete len:120 gc:universal NODE_261_length_11439_cov_1.285538:11287-10928(-)